MTVVRLNSAQVLAVACVGVLLGAWLKRKLPVLERLNLPTPVVGGMIFALVALVLHSRNLTVEADGTLRDLLMIAFMTTIGLSARLKLIREGGAKLLWLLALSSVGAVLQNLLGIGLAKTMGADPRVGILTGSVALAGGPATALAFGATFEKMGVAGATEIGIASATFGIAVAGLIGGYVGGWLIRRHRLKPRAQPTGSKIGHIGAGSADGSLLNMVLIVGMAVGLGNVLSGQIERTGLILPAYIGAMIVAAVIRNLDDRFGFARISQPGVDLVGRVALNLFIVMALVTLRLWELKNLALPMLVILAAEVALCLAMCCTIVYWWMGRDYKAAVESSGFCGYMLGITANAVACMEELVEKYGPAPEAFLVVPVVGAFLIDFANSLVITTMANMLR
jgi:ESS family glutamate:Na+ symporter